jgi:hypothetical protein
VPGLAVPDQEIEEIDGKERVVDAAMGTAGSDVVVYLASKVFYGRRICRVVVG